MKRILWSLVVLIVLTSCNAASEGYTVKGDLRGNVQDGTQVFLRKRSEKNQPMEVDTTTVKEGKFVFKGRADQPEMHFVFVDSVMGYVPLILENGEIEMSAQKDSLGFATIQGTPQNDTFSDYMDASREIFNRRKSIEKDYQTASIEKNEATMASLRDEMKEVNEEFKNFELDFIKNNPNALISVLLIDRAIASQIPLEEIQSLYSSLSPEILKTPAAKRISLKIDEMKARAELSENSEIGAKAPDFKAPTPEGTELTLSEVMGKATLIDFWAAWCRPCRAENPNIVKIYERYHDKGLNVVGVSLDRKAEDWKKAIEDDGLKWNHVSHVAYFNDPIAKLYNVEAIPAAFLLDENGIIVAKNLRGDALEQKVAELLQ